MFIPGGSAIPTSAYNLTNSLRFRASASAFLSRTPASTGSRQRTTYSFWIKRGTLGTLQRYIAASDNATGDFIISWTTGDALDIYDYTAPTTNVGLTTTQVFRDPSAWYHIVIAFDTTQATAANRVKVYVNGNQITAFGSATYPALNANLYNNQASIPARIGIWPSGSQYFDGYMDEINFIDGQALTPSSFGSTNAITGVWQPAPYSGTYGTNGYYLNFTNIALTSGSNTGLGQDFSGNGNFWNTNNISVTAGITYDAMSDVPTLTSATAANYCTGNPLDVSVRGSFSNANLTATTNGGGSLNGGTVRLNTFNFTQVPVKWYWESTVTNAGGGRATYGMETTAFTAQSENWNGTAGWFLRADGVTNLTGATTFAANDVMMFAYDGNTGRFWIGKNGTWTNSGVPASGTNPNRTLTVGTEYWLLFNENTGGAGTAVCAMNFGQRPFVYTPPTDFVRVNTFNLPNSTIVKGNTVMDATLYSGNNTGQTITNAGSFRPDFLWIKVRTNTYDNTLADSVRGVSAFLASNTTAVEGTNSELTSFNSNGFTLGATGSMARNVSGQNYVAWQWQAGQGSNTTNTAGSITSTVSVNTTAGFSIVTYTGTGVNATVGHGLGVAPRMIITKNRSSALNWNTYHASIGNTQTVWLNLNNAATTDGAWQNTTPTSTVFSVAGSSANVTGNGNSIIAYCFAQIAGFSAFSSYTGNGSADGPFVFTGFMPKYLMIKSSSIAGEWAIYDVPRDLYNPMGLGGGRLRANTSAAETSADSAQFIDFLSNGFKIRNTSGFDNQSGATYIYAAFASNPFKNSNAF